MIDVRKVATYVCKRYKKEYGIRIDEMKLHKLLYFIQREAIVQTDEPMFEDKFEAWRYGPVLVRIRQMYKDDDFVYPMTQEEEMYWKPVFDAVFETLASRKSWSLVAIAHGEYSWQKTREGLARDAHCQTEIATDDIRRDADRIKTRKVLLHVLQHQARPR